MRQDRRCPKCDGRAFYVVEKARMSDGQSANGTTPLALAAEYLPSGALGFFGGKMARTEAHVDAWICASCGFSELYVREVDTLRHLLDSGAAGVSFVDGSGGSGGAFR